MLEKLEGLYLCHCQELEGEIPPEMGYLSSVRVLDLCWTRICRIPSSINMLSCLSTLDLTGCDKIEELPDLPASLVILRVRSRSLRVVPNLSKLTNLVELVLSDSTEGGLPYSFGCEASSNPMRTCDLGWIGRLSKLKKLELCLFNVAAPPTELGALSLLENLILNRLDLHALKQLAPSLFYLELDYFNSRVSWLSNLKFLSSLTLQFSHLIKIQLDGLLQLQHLQLTLCVLLERLSIPSSLRTLNVYHCVNLMEIQSPSMLESLEELSINHCNSIERIGCDEVGSLGVLDHSESSSSELTCCAPGVLITDALKKLKRIYMSHCRNLVEIRVVGTLLSLQDFTICYCDGVEKLSSISHWKNLQNLLIYDCPKLRVVEGLDDLEFLIKFEFYMCPLLETSLDISNSKIQDKCLIKVEWCGELLDTSHYITFKRYKKMVLLQRDQNPNP